MIMLAMAMLAMICFVWIHNGNECTFQQVPEPVYLHANRVNPNFPVDRLSIHSAALPKSYIYIHDSCQAYIFNPATQNTTASVLVGWNIYTFISTSTIFKKKKNKKVLDLLS